MVIIQCKEHQLWSADPIKAMKAFYDCQTRQVCSQKKNFENNCIDDRHWATDLNDVREAFYEYVGQVKISNKVFALFKKQMHKSLYADFEKTIERLKKCLENYICDTQLNQLLESNSCRLSCYTNNKEAYTYKCDNSFEEFSESLLNDQCNIICLLVNCLKMYTGDDVIFKLLDVKSLDQDESSNYLKNIYTAIKKIVVSIVFSSCKETVENKPVDCCSQPNYNSGEVLTVNKPKNRPICQSQTANCSSGGELTVNKCDTQPICKSQTVDFKSEGDLTVKKCENRQICKSQTEDCNSGGDLSVNKYENKKTCKLLEVKSLDQDNACNCQKYIYAILKKIVEYISLSSSKKTVEDKPIDCCSQTNGNSSGPLAVNKHENQPNSKLHTADYNLGVDLPLNKHEIRPTCETEDSDGNCCEDNIKLKYELAEMEIIKKQLICEKQLKVVAGYKLLFAMRKASLNIKRENILSYYL